jgi:site-specific recombinase XerC
LFEVPGEGNTMRGFGDYLVRQGLWTINPLRWMKGPKVTPYARLPKRIDRAHMEAMWREAARRGGDYSSHLWVTILAMLYGTGLRRGELERLDVDSFDHNEGTLRIDGLPRQSRAQDTAHDYRCALHATPSDRGTRADAAGRRSMALESRGLFALDRGGTTASAYRFEPGQVFEPRARAS